LRLKRENVRRNPLLDGAHFLNALIIQGRTYVDSRTEYCCGNDKRNGVFFPIKGMHGRTLKGKEVK
jgi:hypothetical protein